MNMGSFTVCASHIGHERDFPQRTIEKIKNADYVIVEFSNNFLEDMQKLQINLSSTIIEYKHNNFFYEEILLKIKKGKSIVFICQNGLPMFADPGLHLFNFLVKNNIKIEIIPGPSIVQSVICLAGLDYFSRGFISYDFFHINNNEKEKILNEIKELNTLIVIVDFSKNTKDTLLAMKNTFNEDRKTSICIDASLPTQEVWTGTYSELILKIDQIGLKGLVSIVSSGKN